MGQLVNLNAVIEGEKTARRIGAALKHQPHVFSKSIIGCRVYLRNGDSTVIQAFDEKSLYPMRGYYKGRPMEWSIMGMTNPEGAESDFDIVGVE